VKARAVAQRLGVTVEHRARFCRTSRERGRDEKEYLKVFSP
jgi:hypothetical protein